MLLKLSLADPFFMPFSEIVKCYCINILKNIFAWFYQHRIYK